MKNQSALSSRNRGKGDMAKVVCDVTFQKKQFEVHFQDALKLQKFLH